MQQARQRPIHPHKRSVHHSYGGSIWGAQPSRQRPAVPLTYTVNELGPPTRGMQAHSGRKGPRLAQHDHVVQENPAQSRWSVPSHEKMASVVSVSGITRPRTTARNLVALTSSPSRRIATSHKIVASEPVIERLGPRSNPMRSACDVRGKMCALYYGRSNQCHREVIDEIGGKRDDGPSN